jgi:hypothetical protein
MHYKGKLYTFGCSMTSYSWPTWADILGKEFSDYENWGRGSAGNLFIFNSIIECLERKKFTSNDTIVILWSGITRIDYYQLGVWSAAHNKSILNDNTASCPDGFEIINYAYFAAIDKLLSANNLNYYMFRFLDYDIDTKAGQVYHETLSKIRKINFKISSKKILKPAEYRIEECYKQLAGTDWPAFAEIFNYDKTKYPNKINQEVNDKFYKELEKNRRLYFDEPTVDNHPTPIEHLTAIKDFFPVTKDTIDWVTDIDSNLLQGRIFNFTKSTPERL